MPACPMKSLSSASGQNSIFTYVCLISNVKPEGSAGNFAANNAQLGTTRIEDEVRDRNDDDATMRLERSLALHEIVEIHHDPHDAGFKDWARAEDSNISNEPANNSDKNDGEKSDEYVNPNILKLTRMEWLSESREGSVDASPTMISPTQSVASYESEEIDEQQMCESERCLATILRVDKEHNLFGLSNITSSFNPKISRKIRREDSKAVFHQTAIIQICYARGCCKHKSASALPASLKQCGRCRNWCSDMPSPGAACCPLTTCKNSTCGSCSQYPCATNPCLPIAWPPKCSDDTACAAGVTIKVLKKPPYQETYPEVIPQSSCELIKPVMARSCHHVPHCIPPSSYFPYCMPCYWPARGVHCSEPARCFHNPPCPKKIKKDCCKQVQTPCGKPCVDPNNAGSKCDNMACIGHNNQALRDALAAKYGNQGAPLSKAE